MLVHNNAGEVPTRIFGLPAAPFHVGVNGVKQDWVLHLAISVGGIDGQLEYSDTRFDANNMADVAAELVNQAEVLAFHPGDIVG